MKLTLFTSLLLASFIAIILAAPEALPTNDDDKDDYDGRHGRSRCLSDRAARNIARRWASLFEGRVDRLDRTVTDDVTFEDETVNFLFGRQEPGPYVTSKAELKGVLEFVRDQPGIRNARFEILILVHDCDTVTFRWRFTGENTGLDPQSTAKAGDPIVFKGIDILEVQKGTRLIKKAYSSSDYLLRLYFAGIKICFQKDAPQPVCSA